MDNVRALHWCWFCGKNETEVFGIVNGPAHHGRNVAICSECTAACAKIFADMKQLKTDEANKASGGNK